jgi:hypothetical protein
MGGRVCCLRQLVSHQGDCNWLDWLATYLLFHVENFRAPATAVCVRTSCSPERRNA